jgi:ADP-heptose:LPS heptosyltransferase
MIELEAIPVNDLAPGEAPGEWSATGHDPQFLLRFPSDVPQISAGWVRIDFEIVFMENARHPRLYWDDGDGFNERNAVFLPFPENGRSRRFMYFDKPLRALRLDPTECETRFRLGALRVASVTKLRAVFAAAWPDASRALRRPSLFGAFLRDLVELWWRGGRESVRAAVQELLATHSGAAMHQFVAVQLSAARRGAAQANGVRSPMLGAVKLFQWRREKKRPRIGIGLVEHFGDIVACEPVVRQLRAAHPGAEICWVVRDVFRELIDSNPHIDQTIAVDCLTDWIKWRAHGVFDRVVDLHVNHRMCQHCGIVLNKHEGNPAITGDNYFNYGGLLKAFSLGAGLVPRDEAPRVYIPDDAVKVVDGFGLPGRFVVLHCRSNAQEKDWDYPRWTELARRLTQTLGVPVVEVGLAPTIHDEAISVINLCGQTTILQMAEVIRRAAVFVGVDSGPAHLANAVGTRGVVLLGQFNKFTSYNPFSGEYGAGRNVTLVRNVHGPAMLIRVDAVFSAVESALSEGSSGRPRMVDLKGATPEVVECLGSEINWKRPT